MGQVQQRRRGLQRGSGGSSLAGDAEAGYMLLAVVVMVAIILIALAVAAPVVTRDLRRDKEVESMHRAQEYDRAIRLFYRKTKTYPASIEAMEKTNNVRYLRHQFVDPLTGQADWRLIRVGQNQTQVSVFFGEPLAGAGGGGLGGGGLGGAGTPTPCASGPVNALGAGFGGATAGGCGSGGATGITGASGATGASGQTKNGLDSSDVSSLGSGGAGPIMGVGSARNGESILVVNEKDNYQEWEFLYDPRIEQLYQKGRMGGGVGSTGLGGFGTGVSGLPGASGSSGGTGPTGTGKSQ